MNKSNTSQRLSEVMRTRNLRQADIIRLAKPYCEKYNVKLNRNDISQYVSGKVLPKQDKLTILGLALDVSEAWLMGFDVPMERDSYKESTSASEQALDIGIRYHDISDVFYDLITKIIQDKEKTQLLSSLLESCIKLNIDDFQLLLTMANKLKKED